MSGRPQNILWDFAPRLDLRRQAQRVDVDQRRAGASAAAVTEGRLGPVTLRRTSSLRFMSRLTEDWDGAARQIRGESVIETPTDQQVRGVRRTVVYPIDESLFVSRLASGFEERE